MVAGTARCVLGQDNSPVAKTLATGVLGGLYLWRTACVIHKHLQIIVGDSW